MRNFIIGTAGHIDHGKTALIKALTGVDTDRLKEEKERGITIDLGFSEITLPSGVRASIVDVPGHEKFIKNMLAGATAMDIILFVVAADEGIMPQSRDHLEILEGLGIKKGIVVLTKCDKVDCEFLELVLESIKEDFKGSFLENARIIKTSSKTGEGLEELKKALDFEFSELDREDVEEEFRLHVDRVFSVKGVGTVVTGTAINGSISCEEEMFIYPEGKKVRVRGIQNHGENITKGYKGNRLALNLAGISKEEVKRGDIIYGKDTLEKSNILEGNFRATVDNIKNKSRVRFYHGTREYIGRVSFIDEEGSYVKIVLEEEGCFLKGDHYFLRNYSPMYNLGGGVILNPKGKRKNKYSKEEIKSLKVIEGGELKEVLLEKIKMEEWTSLEELKSLVNGSFLETLEELILEGKIKVFYKNECLFSLKSYEKIKEKLKEIVEEYHRKNNLSLGISLEEARKKLFIKEVSGVVFREIVEDLIKEEIIDGENGRIKRIGYKISLKKYQENFKNEVLRVLENEEILEERFIEIGKSFNVKSEEGRLLLEYLKEEGKIKILNEGILMLSDSFYKNRELIVNRIKNQGKITLGEARDLINKNRKITLAILEELDKSCITKRVEEVRVLI